VRQPWAGGSCRIERVVQLLRERRRLTTEVVGLAGVELDADSLKALRAAGLVYDADQDAAVQAMMDQSLLLVMDCGPGGITIRATKAREIAAQLVFAAREYLDEHPGVENYVEEQVIDRSTDDRYVVIFTRPRGRTPHELRRLAEARLAAVLGVDLAAIFLDHRRASIDVHDADGGFAATCLCGAWTGPFRRGQTGRTETRTDHERHVAEVVGQAFTHAVEAAC
jgi:hypothetical protein